MWGGIKRAAKKRNIPWEIEIDEAWHIFIGQERKCALSGIPIGFDPGNKTASLDRIDSSLGYVSGNIQWVHKDVNNMKGVYPQSYFIDICTKISAANVELKE